MEEQQHNENNENITNIRAYLFIESYIDDYW